jgi:hypothetical protein
VSLKLDRVGPSVGDGVDKRMCRAQAAIVRLRNFSDQKSPIAKSDGLTER